MKSQIYHSGDTGMAYIQLTSKEVAAVFTVDSKTFLAKPDAKPKSVPLKNYRGYVPWGSEDNIPQNVVAKVEKSPDLSQNLLFNILVGCGSSIIPVKRIVENNEARFVPVFDNQEINDFFLQNDLEGWVGEQLTDLNYFYNTFTEIILNRETPEKRKVVSLAHKEACFSRWEEMDPKTGIVENHFYSSKFYSNESIGEADINATPVLNKRNPVGDMLQRMGRMPRFDTGKIKDDKQYRYIIASEFPTPGRFYYQKPAWYSLFESGWYDFALLIPEYKKALLNNGMTIKYMVQINENYFPQIFAEEGLTTPDEQKKRRNKEYEDIKNFLSGSNNAGKASFSKFKYFGDKKQSMIDIIPMENHFKGGEYIEDSEEVSNILAYGTGVHASLIGSHGKSKTINGTEARELFIIKQVLSQPFRRRVLRPLYVVKAVNKWPEDIYFSIPNIELTTLDKNPTGVKTNINT